MTRLTPSPARAAVRAGLTWKERTMTDMPLYPDENQIAVAVLGPKRSRQWPQIARHLEDKHGLPPIDELLGGRFWPAVVEFFRVRHGMAPAVAASTAAGSTRIRVAPFKPDGKEDFDAVNPSKSKNRPLIKP